MTRYYLVKVFFGFINYFLYLLPCLSRLLEVMGLNLRAKQMKMTKIELLDIISILYSDINYNDAIGIQHLVKNTAPSRVIYILKMECLKNIYFAKSSIILKEQQPFLKRSFIHVNKSRLALI